MRKRSFVAAMSLAVLAVGASTAVASASPAAPATSKVACSPSVVQITWYPEGAFGPPETDCYAGLGTVYDSFDNASYLCSGNYYAGFYTSLGWWYFPGRNQCTQVDDPGAETITEITLQ